MLLIYNICNKQRHTNTTSGRWCRWNAQRFAAKQQIWFDYLQVFPKSRPNEQGKPRLGLQNAPPINSQLQLARLVNSSASRNHEERWIWFSSRERWDELIYFHPSKSYFSTHLSHNFCLVIFPLRSYEWNFSLDAIVVVPSPMIHFDGFLFSVYFHKLISLISVFFFHFISSAEYVKIPITRSPAPVQRASKELWRWIDFDMRAVINLILCPIQLQFFLAGFATWTAEFPRLCGMSDDEDFGMHKRHEMRRQQQKTQNSNWDFWATSSSCFHS